MSQGTPYDPYDQPVQPYGEPYASGATAPVTGYSESTENPTKQAAKDEAAEVKGTAADAGKRVAGTAKEEAANVAVEAKEQAKGLVHQATGEVRSQVETQQQRLAGGISSIASELQNIASGKAASGPITELAGRGADRVGEIGRWLENRDSRELLQEVRYFAQRRPWTFLGGAALAGLLVGRFARGLQADASDSPQSSSNYRTGDNYATGYTPSAGYTESSAYSDTPSSGYVSPGYATTPSASPGTEGTGYESDVYPSGTRLSDEPYGSDRGDLTR